MPSGLLRPGPSMAGRSGSTDFKPALRHGGRHPASGVGCRLPQMGLWRNGRAWAWSSQPGNSRQPGLSIASWPEHTLTENTNGPQPWSGSPVNAGAGLTAARANPGRPYQGLSIKRRHWSPFLGMVWESRDKGGSTSSRNGAGRRQSRGASSYCGPTSKKTTI